MTIKNILCRLIKDVFIFFLQESFSTFNDIENENRKVYQLDRMKNKRADSVYSKEGK